MENLIGPVLLVTPWYPPTIGGVAVVTERLARLFRGEGIATSVWVSDDQLNGRSANGPMSIEILYRSIPARVFYGLGIRSFIATILRAPASLWQTYHFVRKLRIRTVVLLYPTGYAWPFVVLRWMRLIHIVSSCHGNEVLQFSGSSRLARLLFREVLRASDAITVPAAHLIGVMKELVPECPLPIWLIPNCVDDSYFIPRPASISRTDRPTFIHISAFTPRKRTLDIVNAFALATLPTDSRLLMIGQGPDLQAAKALAANLGVAKRVEFIGAPEDVRPFLWESDVLVMASDEESGPITLLEAMSCEIPWIMTPWGIAMTLTPGEYGVVVPGRAPQILAKAMEEMLDDPGRLRKMGASGRKKVVEEFGQAKYLERHLTLIRAVERGEAHATVDYSVAAAAQQSLAISVTENKVTAAVTPQSKATI